MQLPSPDHAIVTFVGSDALTFLQSQLTNDVAALAVGNWQWQGYCSAKGRLQATFALARTGAEAFAAVVHNSVAATLVKRLAMFRMRAKLAIELTASLVPTLHLTQPETAPKPLATIDLGHDRWMTVASRADASVDPAQVQLGALGNSHAFMQRWNSLGIEAMQPEITAATAEMFVPQMINWDHVQPGGGVSFSKGCYPGQEVVARAHYRGAVKRGLSQQTIIASTPPELGAQATTKSGIVGEVCNIAPSHPAKGEFAALIVAQISARTIN